MEIVVPLVKSRHNIGHIGESIFQQIAEYYNLDVIGKEFSIRDYKNTGDSIRVDFVVGNDQRKNKTLKKMVKNLSSNRIYSVDSMVIIKHNDEEKRYNISNYDEIIDFVIDNFTLVEIKTSTHKYYLSKTKTQKKLEYYDTIVRIKIDKKYHGGFVGELRELGYCEFLNLLNIKYDVSDKTQLTIKLLESRSTPIIQKILHTGLHNYFRTRNYRLDNDYELRTIDNYDELSKLRYVERYDEHRVNILPHLIDSNYLINMGNKVKKSKNKAKKENLVIMRYKIQGTETKKSKYDGRMLGNIYLEKSIMDSGFYRTVINSNLEDYEKLLDYYENHDIFLWDFKKQKKEYDKLDKQRLQLKIDFSIDGRQILNESSTDPNDCILKVDMDSDFNRGFKFTVNDEDITRIMLKTRV